MGFFFLFVCFCGFFIQRSISESFVGLCFLCSEAGKWIAWLYLSWDSIPKGCAWKWEASFEKIYSNFGQCYESRCGASFEILQSTQSCIYVLFPIWNPWWQSTAVQQQASVLGPVQFTLYLQPLSDLISCQECDYHKYADDTQLSKAAPADQQVL